MGGTDTSADDLLAGAEDVMRRRGGQGHGAGDLHPRVAAHQGPGSAEDYQHMDLHDRLPSVYRQAEADKPHHEHA